MISVIIPAYNAEKTIGYCMDSICNAIGRRPDIEIIIVNDGSTDNTESVVKNRIEQTWRSYTIKIFSKVNGGVSSARNLGLSHALGDWILFVDADDQVSLSIFDNLCPLLDGALDKTPTLYLFSFEIANACTKRVLGFQDESIDIRTVLSDEAYNDIIDAVLCTTYNKLYNHNVIKQHDIRFPEEVKIGEDFIFNTKYFQYIPQLKLISKVFYTYNNLDGTAIGKFYQHYDSYILGMSKGYAALISALGIDTASVHSIKNRFLSARWLYATERCVNSNLPIKYKVATLNRWYKEIDPPLLNEIAVNHAAQYSICAHYYINGKSMYLCIIKLTVSNLFLRLRSNIYRLKQNLLGANIISL